MTELRFDHVAVAVRSIKQALPLYRDALGGEYLMGGEPDGTWRWLQLRFPGGAGKIELLEPLGEASPIARFLERNPDGGVHHVCYEVDDIIAARDRLKSEGARVLGDGEPKTGAHGKPVLFLHPKDFLGTLVELEQA